MNLATLTQPTLADKAVPGHNPSANQSFWLVAGTNNNKNAHWWNNGPSAAQLAGFEAVQIRIFWSEIEGPGDGGAGPGVYDFAKLRAALNYGREKKIPVLFLIQERKFSYQTFDGPNGLTADVMPSDLVAAGYQAQQGTAQTPGGPIACMYSSVASGRYRLMFKAVLDAFKDNPYFAGAGPGETAGQTTPDVNVAPFIAPAENYTHTKYTTALNAKHIDLAGHCPYVWYIPGWNYIPDRNSLSDSVAAWKLVWANVPRSNVMPWTPDIFTVDGTKAPGLYARVFPILSSALANSVAEVDAPIREFRRVSSLQFDSHRPAENLNASIPDLLLIGKNDLDLDVIFCTYSPNTPLNFNGHTAPAVLAGWPA